MSRTTLIMAGIALLAIPAFAGQRYELNINTSGTAIELQLASDIQTALAVFPAFRPDPNAINLTLNLIHIPTSEGPIVIAVLTQPMDDGRSAYISAFAARGPNLKRVVKICVAQLAETVTPPPQASPAE